MVKITLEQFIAKRDGARQNRLESFCRKTGIQYEPLLIGIVKAYYKGLNFDMHVFRNSPILARVEKRSGGRVTP